MSEPEFDSSPLSAEDNVETDRNEAARSAVENNSDDEDVRHEGEEDEPENHDDKLEHQEGDFVGDTTPQAVAKKDSDDDSDGETIKAVTAAANKATASYLSSDSEHGSPRIRKGSTEPDDGALEPPHDKAE